MTVQQQELANTWRGTTEGGALKATINWNSPNTGAVNSSGFTALPGGHCTSNVAYYYVDGSYYNVGRNGIWWSSTEDSSSYAWYRKLTYNSSAVYRNYDSKREGFSVRCVRD